MLNTNKVRFLAVVLSFQVLGISPAEEAKRPAPSPSKPFEIPAPADLLFPIHSVLNPDPQEGWHQTAMGVSDRFRKAQIKFNGRIEFRNTTDIDYFHKFHLLNDRLAKNSGRKSWTLDNRNAPLYFSVLRTARDAGYSEATSEDLGKMYLGLFDREHAPDLPNFKALMKLGTYKPSELAKAISELQDKGTRPGFKTLLIDMVDKIGPEELLRLIIYANDRVKTYYPEVAEVVAGKRFYPLPISEGQAYWLLEDLLKNQMSLASDEKGRAILDNPEINEVFGGTSSLNTSSDVLRMAYPESAQAAATQTSYELLKRMEERLKRIEANQINTKTETGTRNKKGTPTTHGAESTPSQEMLSDEEAEFQKDLREVTKEMKATLPKLNKFLDAEEKKAKEAADDAGKRLVIERQKELMTKQLHVSYALVATMQAIFPHDVEVAAASEIALTVIEINKNSFSPEFESSPLLQWTNIYISLLNLGLRLSNIMSHNKSDTDLIMDQFEELSRQIQNLEKKMTYMYESQKDRLTTIHASVTHQLREIRSLIEGVDESLWSSTVDIQRKQNDILAKLFAAEHEGREKEIQKDSERLQFLCRQLKTSRQHESVRAGESPSKADMQHAEAMCGPWFDELLLLTSGHPSTTPYTGNIGPIGNWNDFYVGVGSQSTHSGFDLNIGDLTRALEKHGVQLIPKPKTVLRGAELPSEGNVFSKLPNSRQYSIGQKTLASVYRANGINGSHQLRRIFDPNLDSLREAISENIRIQENYDRIAGLDKQNRINPELTLNLLHGFREQLKVLFDSLDHRIASAI